MWAKVLNFFTSSPGEGNIFSSLINKIMPQTKNEKAAIKSAAVNQSNDWKYKHSGQEFDSYASARLYDPRGGFSSIVRPFITILTYLYYGLFKVLIYKSTGTMEFTEFDGWLLMTVTIFWFGGRPIEKGIIRKMTYQHNQNKKPESRFTMFINAEQLEKMQSIPELKNGLTGAVAITESRHDGNVVNMHAWRFEPLQYKNGRTKSEATSWGAFQIMGYRLVELGILQDLGGSDLDDVLPIYLNSAELQLKYFNKYYAKFMAGKYSGNKEFYSLYNTNKIKNLNSTGTKNVARFLRIYSEFTSSMLPFLVITGLLLFTGWQGAKYIS
jgi:hypothetical protein